MLQTPWYLDYGHLVFWFFFFSTFVIVMWLFYIYVSIAYNIETRRPVRETRGFSRAQVGDTMTAVLPLTWSVTMLAHASVHSTNFDENTTATVFSFSVIAYQWGWNYYFPRDVVDVLSGSPVLLGHKRVASLYTQDVYSSLLAQARQEYYSKILSTNQLSARHGKHTLNQFLQAAFVGPRYTREHSWLMSGLAPALDFTQPKVGQKVTSAVSGVGATGSDQLLLLSKDLRLSSSLANVESLKLGMFASSQIRGLGDLKTTDVTTPYSVQPRAVLFDQAYGRRRGSTNPFRAHNTAVHVGNRLNGVHRHLTSSSVLNEGYTGLSRQSFLVQGLNRALPASLDGVALYRLTDVSQDVRFETAARVGIENIGVNLALTRAGRVTQPWLGSLGEMGRRTLAGEAGYSGVSKAAFSSVGLIDFHGFLPKIDHLDRTVLASRASLVSKDSSGFWLQAEDFLSDAMGSRGNLNTVRIAQRYHFSGAELALSGGESQKLQASDVSGLSANSTVELGNLTKALLRGQGITQLVNTQTSVSMLSLPAEDLSRLGFLASVGSGFFSLDSLVRSEISGGTQTLENRVLWESRVLSTMQPVNSGSVLSLLRKDLHGGYLGGFAEFKSFELLSESASSIRSSRLGLKFLSVNSTGNAPVSAVTAGSKGFNELTLRSLDLTGIQGWNKSTCLFVSLACESSSASEFALQPLWSKSTEEISAETSPALAFVAFLGERLRGFNQTLWFLRTMAELDLKHAIGGGSSLTVDGSADGLACAEQPYLTQEEGFSPMFPYLSDGEAERCVLRTPVVFIDLTWGDRVVRGALCKDVTFSRLSTDAKVVFNDTELMLALGLYFPVLAFPLNDVGSSLLTELFPLLPQSTCAKSSLSMYGTYAPFHTKLLYYLSLFSDSDKSALSALRGLSSFVSQQAVICGLNTLGVGVVLQKYTNTVNPVLPMLANPEIKSDWVTTWTMWLGSHHDLLHTLLILNSPAWFYAFTLKTFGQLKNDTRLLLWEVEFLLLDLAGVYESVLSTGPALFDLRYLSAMYAEVRTQAYLSWHFGISFSDATPFVYLYEHLLYPSYVYLHFYSSLYSECTWLSSRAGEILFFWHLGLVTAGDVLFNFLLDAASDKTVTVDNLLPAHEVAGHPDSALGLKDVKGVVAVRLALTALYYAYPLNTDTSTTLIARGLQVSPAHPVCFSIGVGIDPTLTSLWGNLNSSAKESIVGESVNAPLAVSALLRFGYLVPLYPALDTHWLEGVSDVYPTRVSDPASSDIIFLNSKDLKPLTRQLLHSSSLFDWWSRWSWEVLSVGLPWDKLYRSITTKRGLGGLLNSTYAFDAAKQIELSELSRQRFDKNSTELYAPAFRKIKILPVFPELSTLALDVEFGSQVVTPILTLPTPHLDIDPSFIFFNLTPEVNTSRRSDHDARYKVSWGPLAATLVASQSSAPIQDTAWAKKSGPSALTTISPKVLQSFTLMSNIDLFLSVSNTAVMGSRLSAQPLPGSMFSDSVQAPLSSAVPCSQPTSGYPGLGYPFGIKGADSSLSVLSGKEAVRGVLLEEGTGFLSSQSLTLTADWANIWQFYTKTNAELVNQSTGFDAAGHNLMLLKLCLAGGHQQKISALLSWKQHKLISLERASTGFNAALLYRTLGQTLQSTKLPQTEYTDSGASGKRSGYAPIQPGVSNMRRLRVTQGIYLPADLPIHGIFGSKDVIHSWAIPGLGVKVDCIPGYSSHRRLFFRWRGLFWGQCMEVCGRYHHWMPLLVRIVHKDVFILWCLTYLRLLTSNTLTGAYAFSVENSKQVWDVASAATLCSASTDIRAALLGSTLRL